MNLSKPIIHIKKHKILYAIIVILFVFYLFCLPRQLFPNDFSTVVYGKNGELLGARISKDAQWRFPADSAVSDKFKKAIVAFEDQYFQFHPGFNPVSLARATFRNLKSQKIVSGGSTISMQVIRLYRNHRHRTVFEKIVEIILATRLEIRYSKDEIFRLYASQAPFGGNVVGVSAASWRFFGRKPADLSWAEAALLAVLPNSPSSIHPGKNRKVLLDKRNRLIKKLFDKGYMDAEMYRLSLLEPIPMQPLPLPDLAPHVTEFLKGNHPGEALRTTLQKHLQDNLNRIVSDYYNQLNINEIQNTGVVVIEVATGNVLAYVGNVPREKARVDGQFMDMVQATRSTGSLLKPLLYMAMLQEGSILPGTLVPDIPTRIAGFKPDNYDLTYDGAVPAKKALARSLNIPAVRMLQGYGIPKFQNYLQKLGLTTLTFSPDHYGLTLIVGGAEGKLSEIAGTYAALSRTLTHYNNHNTYPNYWDPSIKFFNDKPINEKEINFLNAGAIWSMFEALLEVNRPDEEAGWVNISSARKVAWKTGTSYGFRDAWAVGTTPEYVVGVWVGNADGEGRPGLTGVGAAAPLLFRVFGVLPATTWFQKPFDELEKIPVCHLSGYKAGPYCDDIDSIYVVRAGLKTGLCPYHVLIHVSSDGKFQVNSKCESTSKMIHKHWFVLPPAMEWFYRKKNFSYHSLPPFKRGCNDDESFAMMELIYPTDVLKIFIPRELDGAPGSAVFEVAHRNPNATLYWHIDNEFMGNTRAIHQLQVRPAVGKHFLTIVDDNGRTLSRSFEVIDKK